jgi:large subunit ribosomal protein L21
MYAVIETGGKQYRVSPGQTIEVEVLPAEPGSTVTLDRVLLVSNEDETLVGQPLVPGAHVVATVTREGRGEKILVFKYKAKKRYRRTQGHRQNYVALTITDIHANGASLVADEDRRRYERHATRMARRFEERMLVKELLATGMADQLVTMDAEDEEVDEDREAELEADEATAAAPETENEDEDEEE